MEINVILLTIVTIIFIGYLYIRRKFSYWESKGVPYVTPEFPHGNLKGIGSVIHGSQIMQKLYNNLKGKGPFGGIYMFIQPGILVTDPELAKNIFVKDFDYFHDRGIFFNEKDDPLSGHLFALEGQRWKNVRAKLSPTFTSGKMRMMFNTVLDVGNEFCKYLLPFAEKSSEIEMKDIAARFTTDVIGSCAFGIECNSLKDPDNEFRKMAHKIFDEPTISTIRVFFMSIFRDFSRKLGLKITDPDVSKFFLGVVRDTVDYREKNDVKRNDFMNLLLQIKNFGKITDDNEEPATSTNLGMLTFNELAAQSFVFFIAGFETSSTAMSFCLHELCKNEKIQEKLRAEIMQVLEKHNGEVTYDAIMEMHYLDNVVNESLRMYPPVDNIVRTVDRDYKVPNTDKIMPKGALLIIPVFAFHRDPENFPNPEVFDPDRFTNENIKTRHPYSFIPFGEGPRNCIGMRFGVLQVKIGLIKILSKYKISCSEKTQKNVTFKTNASILTSSTGLWLKIDKI